jgi:hypothetical protein
VEEVEGEFSQEIFRTFLFVGNDRASERRHLGSAEAAIAAALNFRAAFSATASPETYWQHSINPSVRT